MHHLRWTRCARSTQLPPTEQADEQQHGQAVVPAPQVRPIVDPGIRRPGLAVAEVAPPFVEQLLEASLCLEQVRAGAEKLACLLGREGIRDLESIPDRQAGD